LTRRVTIYNVLVNTYTACFNFQNLVLLSTVYLIPYWVLDEGDLKFSLGTGSCEVTCFLYRICLDASIARNVNQPIDSALHD
jgi:hypothetical protein